MITLYLLPQGLIQIERKIISWLKGKSGRRVVCNTWGFKGWKEKERRSVEEFNGTDLWLYDVESVPVTELERNEGGC